MAVRIFCQNVTSMREKKRVIELEQNIIQERATVVLLQELHTPDNRRIALKGLKIFRCDDGVGTAVFVNDRVQAERVMIRGITKVNYTAVKIKRNKGHMLVMSLYIPVNSPTDQLEEDLKLIFEETDKYQEVIIGGDLNAKHRTWNVKPEDTENRNGKTLFNVLCDYPEIARISTVDNTFRGQSKLDHFLVDRILVHEGVKVRKGSSTWCHEPIILDTRIKRGQLGTRSIPTRVSYTGTDWEAARGRYSDELYRVEIPKDRLMEIWEIDRTIEEVTSVISNVTEVVTKKTMVREGDLE